MFLDICFGLTLSVIGQEYLELTPGMILISVSITSALFPDIDFFIELFHHGSVGGKKIREHREILHFPLLYIPLVGILLLLDFSWGALIGIGLLWHFLHDSIGIGWGIKWLWPLRSHSFKFFAKKKTGEMSWNPVIIWTDEELPAIVHEHGDPDWIRNIYFKPHPIGISEHVISLLLLAYFIANMM